MKQLLVIPAAASFLMLMTFLIWKFYAEDYLQHQVCVRDTEKAPSMFWLMFQFLCFARLIHQKSSSAYFAFTAPLVEKKRRHLIPTRKNDDQDFGDINMKIILYDIPNTSHSTATIVECHAEDTSRQNSKASAQQLFIGNRLQFCFVTRLDQNCRASWDQCRRFP